MPEVMKKIGAELDNFVYRVEPEASGNLGNKLYLDAKLTVAYGSSLLVGGVAGLLVVGFELTTDLIRDLGLEVWLPIVGTSKAEMLEYFGQIEGLPAIGSAWPIAVIPLAGGIGITCIRLLLNNDLGVPLSALNKDPGQNASKIEPAKVITKAGSAAITLGTGNSLGPEGPVVELGGNVGLYLGRRLGFQDDDLRGFLAAGTAAGLAAGFNAPIAAIFFALEMVLQKTNNKNTITMTLLSAVTAASIKDAILGLNPKFDIGELSGLGLSELPMYLVVGAACGVMAYFFEWVGARNRRVFQGLEDAGVRPELHPLIGSAVMAAVALVFPETLFFGYKGVSNLLTEDTEMVSLAMVGTLLLISPAKVFTTAVAQSSGLVGGVFAPALFIGATTGAAVGALGSLAGLGSAGAGMVSDPALYALIGMPSMLAAYIKAPLTSILLLFEVTRDYSVVVPVMAGVSMSVFTNLQIQKLLNPAADSTPGWLPANARPTMETSAATSAMISDVVQLPAGTSLLAAARSISDAQLNQSKVSCRGVVILGDEEGEVLGAATVETVARRVAQVSAKLRESFEEIDADNSGLIELNEMELLIDKICPGHQQITAEEVKSLFDFMDTDGKGSLDFKEFVAGVDKVGNGTTVQTLEALVPAVANGGSPNVVLTTATLFEAAQALEDCGQDCVPVVSTEGEVKGIIIEPALKNAIQIAMIDQDLESMTI